MNIYLQNEGELLMDHLLHIGVYKGCTDNIYTLYHQKCNLFTRLSSQDDKNRCSCIQVTSFSWL